MQNVELRHARFGHIGYGSLLFLQQHNMLQDMSFVEVPPKNVCVLGKMRKFAFPKDGSIRAVQKL